MNLEILSSDSSSMSWFRRNRWLTLAVVVGLGVLGYFGFRPKRATQPSARAVPVTIAVARKGDLPVRFTAMGTVTALNMVTVKSRVDGQLVRVAFQEGQFVQEGQLLAEIDPRPFQVQLMQAEGQQAKDQASFDNASADLRRLQTLAQQGIISVQQMEAQKTAVAQYEAALKADRAQVESAKLNLTYSRIVAPIAGQAGLRQVEPGNMVRASDANGLVVIAPMRPISVLFTLPSDKVSQVLEARRKTPKLPVEALDRDLKTSLGQGSVAAMDNQVDAATGTVRLKALFANDGAAPLFPNQFVNVRVQVDTLKDALLVPTEAVQQGAQGPYVYVVKEDQTVEMRGVEIRATDGDLTALSSGVKPGEKVVTEGIEKLRPGVKVALPKADPAKSKP